MHQLAIAMKLAGKRVLGYDAKTNQYTDQCVRCGIAVTNRFKSEFCSVDLCVKTGAIKEDNRYVTLLRKLNIPIVDRADFLAYLAGEFKCVIAVAGTHGKSTTASIIYEILRQNGEKVSCHIGADVFAPRFVLGDDYLVVEACEYNRSFLSLKPTICVVTNVEAEHMDSYGSLFNLKMAFMTFLKRGRYRFVSDNASTKYLTKVKDVAFVTRTDLSISPKLKGDYNLDNISLAIAVCTKLGVETDTIIRAVNSFQGVARRYECIGKYKGRKVYIDYAHHPSEVKAFISAFSSEYEDPLIVFQPHTYSRTKFLLREFLDTLGGVKNLLIFKEYPAREKPTAGLSARDLFHELKKINLNVKYVASAVNVKKYIIDQSAIAFVGAGDIDQIARKIIERN